jgi:transposase
VSTCGVDVHRDLLVATILIEASKDTKRFDNSTDGINSIKQWLKEHNCSRVVMESSGIYWVPLYLALEESNFKVTLANALQVKGIPGRKTDQSDSEWLAYLLRSDLVKPSYVPEKRVRELRELTRLRVKLVGTRTSFKNRCHKVLNRVNIRLGSKLSDVFGKAGLEVLNGLMDGKSVDTILRDTNSKMLKKKADEIKTVVRGVLNQSDIFILKECVDMVKQVDEKIVKVDCQIEMLVDEHSIEIVASVPGVGRKAAAAIMAEVGDASRFASGKHIASAAGLAPSVYQSAGKCFTGGITKQGSKWLRRIMVEVAHSAVKARDSVLRDFYLRVQARHGPKTAIVALARKMLTIIHHLLVNDERYVEEGYSKVKVCGKRLVVGVSFEDMVLILRNAGYVVKGPFG